MSRIRTDAHVVAGWVSLPFIAVLVLDGFWKTTLLQQGVLAYWVFDLFKWIVLPGASLLVLHRLASISPRQYGLSAEFGAGDIFIVSALPLMALFFLHFFSSILAEKIFGYSAPYFANQAALKPLGPLWILGTIYFSATAGLWESIFVIGLPWFWFSRGRSVPIWHARWFALFLSIVFAAGHWENGLANATAAFAFQLMAIWWYVKLRTLWPVIIAHFLIDVIYFWPPN